MADLSRFEITRRWPPRDPGKIQLYSVATPNGIKVSTALEEMGLPYEAHFVSFAAQEQESPEFLSLNPNNKIPAIIDPDGPGGQPLALFESGAILIYLAEKTGKFLPADPAGRYHAIQWLMFQMGGIGPAFGQLGRVLGQPDPDPGALRRHGEEAERLLDVLDGRLAGRDWVAGEYGIADMAIFPWLRELVENYGAADRVDWDLLDNVPAYLRRCLDRPAVRRALTVPARPAAGG